MASEQPSSSKKSFMETDPILNEEKRQEKEFVNHGRERWHRMRAEWTKNSEVDMTTEETQDFNDMDDAIDDLMNDEELDAEHVIYCLRQYIRFPDPISLKTIVNLLNILWDDEFV
mmetsp:Transcript_33642/g.46919  ORF Transcript_33642/g.46919 Transcript_33642/m.46919 type:complete len:115 (+) Transcript_33642:82-426(+)|eukprot:CAMPEP_0185264724 /NCGR_PEP_ID=MMETSP1359-20130426/24510_1 /TAXON_ID=552665 /ORGANISM="Bigelowiella longifila, Strain CCMP242" /LENGTH=114 /DNA_ID=CAMNT_0027853497 /DNA_START=27 /DNA_END=371 /DNA_ORIENTATION=+